MRSRLQRDLTSALKARDTIAIAALRSAIAAIDNAEAVAVNFAAPRRYSSGYIAGSRSGPGSAEVERRVLSDADLQALIRAQVHERSQAAQEYERLGHQDVADRLRREADVLFAHLAALE